MAARHTAAITAATMAGVLLFFLGVSATTVTGLSTMVSDSSKGLSRMLRNSFMLCGRSSFLSRIDVVTALRVGWEMSAGRGTMSLPARSWLALGGVMPVRSL